MKNKIIIVLLVLVIAVGTIIAVTSGFNLGFDYGVSKRLNIQFKESFEIEDIALMAKEVFNDAEYKIDYIDEFKAGVVIKVQNITDEQVTELENKLKEKYKTFADKDTEENEDNKNDVVTVIDMPNVVIYDLIKVYIKPVIITTIIVIILLGIAFRKLGLVKAVVMPICLVFGINAIYISAIAILRIPINAYVIAIGVFVYGMSLIGTTLYMKSQKD